MFIEPAALLVFLMATTAICITPGPDMLYILANGLTKGPAAGFTAACGMALGMVCHTAAVALGLSALLATVPLAFEIVRYVGAAYLLWLAVKSFREPAIQVGAVETAAAPLRRIFWQALATNLLNPKIALFYLAFLPQFASPANGSVAGQLLMLGVLFVIVGLLVDSVIGVLSGRVGLTLLRNRQVAAALKWLPGVVFIGLAARLVLAERR
ncbi:LysE family translocator [Rhodospirillaceae bacterium SYSU D60014]|uniref:LysE family translocator n=1 Tax=Virgifigura deserti TaxID=2268457 RepID=UPI000E66F92C